MLGIRDIIYVKEAGTNYAGHSKYFLTMSDYLTRIVMNAFQDKEQIKTAVDEIMATLSNEKPLDIMSERAALLGPRDVFYHATFLQTKRDVMEILSEDRLVTNPDSFYSFDVSKCSPELVEMLRLKEGLKFGNEIPPRFLYALMPKRFEAGDEVHNLNGEDYRVLYQLNPDTHLLCRKSDQAVVIVENMCYYRKFPEDHPEYVQEGVQWGSGKYLGNDLGTINFKQIFEAYGYDVYEHKKAIPEAATKTDYEMDRNVENITTVQKER